LTPGIPLQRFGTEAEVSAAIVYLLSPAASYITGSCIRIDGGAPNARRGWWALQPAKNNAAFDGFHRSSLPAILDEVP
jgi:citronellol/citronellal dehydrogenase